MRLLVMELHAFMPVSAQPGFGVVAVLVGTLGFFCLIIWGLTSKTRDNEAMEGVWYCKELQMQISFTDPRDAFLMQNGVKIQCRSDTYVAKYHDILELYCQEWELPGLAHGKTLFTAEIRQYKDLSMVVYDRKAGREYTFVRTDKAE